MALLMQLAGVLDGVAGCWRSYGGVVDGACSQLAHSTINGIEVLPACALMMA